MILKFFDIFLKMKDLTTSEAFLVGFMFWVKICSCHARFEKYRTFYDLANV